jgi:signal transduction histidine kinase
VANARDVTEQRLLEEQLQQAQKLESIGRLAGGVAHDFNNLPAVILSGAEAVKGAAGLDPSPHPEIAEEIIAAGKLASDLTRRLLAFAREQVIVPIPVDLNALIRRSEKLLRRVLGSEVELVTALHQSLWSVLCDPAEIERVFLNLAGNARDAMPNGGTLTIETANADMNESLTASHPWMRPLARVGVRPDGDGHAREPEKHRLPKVGVPGRRRSSRSSPP